MVSRSKLTREKNDSRMLDSRMCATCWPCLGRSIGLMACRPSNRLGPFMTGICSRSCISSDRSDTVTPRPHYPPPQQAVPPISSEVLLTTPSLLHPLVGRPSQARPYELSPVQNPILRSPCRSSVTFYNVGGLSSKKGSQRDFGMTLELKVIGKCFR